MIKWIRTSQSSINNSLSLLFREEVFEGGEVFRLVDIWRIYRGTSLIRNHLLLGLYSRPTCMPRSL
jgi:hypothetical protein